MASTEDLKNSQNGTFRSVHGIWNFFGTNNFIWGAIIVPLFEFIQKMSQTPSSSVQVLNWEDKLDYLKNPSQDFKNYFCIGFLSIPSNAGRQNYFLLYVLSFSPIYFYILTKLQTLRRIVNAVRTQTGLQFWEVLFLHYVIWPCDINEDFMYIMCIN